MDMHTLEEYIVQFDSPAEGCMYQFPTKKRKNRISDGIIQTVMVLRRLGATAGVF